MRRLHALGIAAMLAAPLAAQQGLPAGWKGRLDDGGPLSAVKMAPMGGGVHFMTGPAAGIYYRPADRKSGAYTARAEFRQMEPAAHPEAYGIFIGGSDLDGAGQKYTYFVIRQDGKYLLKRRAGAATPTLVDWTDSPSIHKADASGRMTNTLAIEVGADTVRFLVNGAEVTSAATSKVDAAGIAGLRINHNLNVHVEGFSLQSR
jgi:hypothetical protein